MKKNDILICVFHIFCWIVMTLPVLMVPQHEQRTLAMTLMSMSFPLGMCFVFYVNYLWLVPSCFMKRRMRVYVGVNIVTVLAVAAVIHRIMSVMHGMEVEAGWRMQPFERPSSWVPVLAGYVFKECLPMVLAAAMGTLLRIALAWQKTEAARKEMEKEKAEAELKYLRNQINPHFLLNTMNNIYALIAFDKEKAQKAVLSLSSMLRSMLYATDGNSVPLADETELIRNYIDLMRLRTGKNVKIDVDIALAPADREVRIAPFILISLVENAFKHGISPVKPSFVSVSIHSDGEKIECDIRNSNFPKSPSDKSGHGIGLTQVARRLALAYGDKYEWVKGTDTGGQTYISKITIYDTQLCDNR